MDEAKISDIYKYSCLRAKNRHLFLEQPPRARIENSVEAAFWRSTMCLYTSLRIEGEK